MANSDLHPCSSSSLGISPVVRHEDEPEDKRQKTQEEQEGDGQEESAKRRRVGEAAGDREAAAGEEEESEGDKVFERAREEAEEMAKAEITLEMEGPSRVT